MIQETRFVDWLSAIGSIIGAVGTVGAVIVALFQDQLRDWLFPASAVLELNDSLKELTKFGQQKNSEMSEALVYMVHLRVRNTSGRRSLHHCSVVLEELSLQSSGEGWRTQTLPVPLNFRWAPFEMRPLEIDLRAGETATVNLFWLYELSTDWLLDTKKPRKAIVKPVLAAEPNNFAGNLTSAGTIRYHISLRADELGEPVRAVFEVEWNGHWPETDESFDTKLRISRLSSASMIVRKQS